MKPITIYENNSILKFVSCMLFVLIIYSLSLSLSSCMLGGSSTYYIILFFINYFYLFNLILYWDYIILFITSNVKELIVT